MKVKEINGLTVVTIEEIYEQGTPVVRVFETGLISVGGTYLHHFARIRQVDNYDLFVYGFSLYQEVDVRGFNTSGNSLLTDWSWQRIEEEADNWISEIEEIENE